MNEHQEHQQEPFDTEAFQLDRPIWQVQVSPNRFVHGPANVGCYIFGGTNCDRCHKPAGTYAPQIEHADKIINAFCQDCWDNHAKRIR